MQIQKKYVYPKLPARYCFPDFRIGGSGLANCLFVAARARVLAQQKHLALIEPTWLNFSIGPYLRHQQDKRHYNGLFRSGNQISGWKKFVLLTFRRAAIIEEKGLQNYFQDILADVPLVRSYLREIVRPKCLAPVDAFDFTNAVAVHIRLGDYVEKLRIPLTWYETVMEKIRQTIPGKGTRFLLFSDGSDDELAPLLRHTDTQRVFFGNALADIFAISQCTFLIGSDSTFSGWGAYLGQLPCCFLRKHYGPILQDAQREYIFSDFSETDLSFDAFLRMIFSTVNGASAEQ